MGMERLLQIQKTACTKYAMAYETAIKEGQPQSVLSHALRTIKRGMPETPSWVYSYLDGWHDCKREELYRNYLEYRDGSYYWEHNGNLWYSSEEG